MSGLRAVAALRFREAFAGGMLWLLPLHFAIAFAVVRTLPGPTLEARLQAADATALGLAAILGLVAAAVMGASPLAAERLRPRGTLVLAAPVSPPARVLGAALGTAGALLLLVLGLGASAMAAVDLGVGGARANPIEVLNAVETYNPFQRNLTREDLLKQKDAVVWTSDPKMPRIWVEFPRSLHAGEILVVNARPDRRLGVVPGVQRARFNFKNMSGGDFGPLLGRSVGYTEECENRASPFRVKVPVECEFVEVLTALGESAIGLSKEDVRLEGAPQPRALARGLHAAALFGGLLAVMGAGMALSTVTGAGVAAGGALALAGLSLSQPLFADAADTLAYAGAMERTIQATLNAGEVAVAQTGTPPALAPVFRAIAAVLPDGTRFDLTAAVAANEVPWTGDVARAVGLGLALGAAFLAVAILGARRKP